MSTFVARRTEYLAGQNKIDRKVTRPSYLQVATGTGRDSAPWWRAGDRVVFRVFNWDQDTGEF
jgi:hypothetical protein